MNMMTYNIDPFNTVGFDRLFDRMSKMHETVQNQSNYPPYNIVKSGEDRYVIELAVAGFTYEELDIVCTYYNVNHVVGREYLSLLSKEQIQIMKKEQEKGGTKK